MRPMPRRSLSSLTQTARQQTSPMSEPSGGRLEFVIKRGRPEPRERFRIRALNHELVLSSRDHSQR
jgi:hypothetical protein